MTRWLVLFTLLASCRGKDNGGAPVGSAGKPTTAAAKGGRWSAVISAGKATGVRSLASGPIGTFLVTARTAGSPVVANGKEVVGASNDEGDAFIQLDHKGTATWGTVIEETGLAPAFAVGSSDAVASIGATSIAAKGAIVTLPNKAMMPVDGNVLALTRTDSGTIWVSGRNWGSDDPLAEGKCDRKAFLARRTPTGVDVVDCDSGWTNMHLAASGDDVVMCASDGNEIGGKAIEGQTFLARIGGDGKLKWLRAINEVGDAACDDVVVTSDGDIVATGTANENADLSEGAKAKGVKVKSSAGLGLDRLWLARYDGGGTRRWARVIAQSTVGFSASLDVDRSGNALLTSGTNTPLDLGNGPVGPNGGVMVAIIGRDAKVNGLFALPGAGKTYAEQAVVDSEDGVVFAFSTNEPITVGGVNFQSPKGGNEYIGVVRMPLPLPAP